MSRSDMIFTDGSYTVQIKGLSSLLKWLKDSDPKMRKGMRDGLRDAARPVLAKARANARAIADDGTMAGSLTITSRQGGAQWLLASSDEAAPVKEFARIGAVTISSKGTPRANARLREHSGVGVPRRANQPRVMIPAVNDSAESVRDTIDEALEKVLEGAGNG